MVFLLIRFLPYFIPLGYFVLAKAIYYYNDWWWLFILLGLVLILINFILLKIKNRQKPVLALALFAVVYYFAGLCYFLILENSYVINLFLIGWSLILWLYLESVFHDFYETTHTHVLNLQNISLYGSILIVFFLSSSLISFNIFLNWPKLSILLILGLSYLAIINLAFRQQQVDQDRAWLYSSIISLILVELLTSLLYLPVSFYVVSIIASLAYYLLLSLSLLAFKKQLTASAFWRYLVFCLAVIVAVGLTAVWL